MPTRASTLQRRPYRAAALLIERRDGAAFLAAERLEFTVGERDYAPAPSTSLLWERSRSLLRECRDEPPRVLH